MTNDEAHRLAGSDTPRLTRLFAISTGDEESRPYPGICENCAPVIPLRPAAAPRAAVVAPQQPSRLRDMSDDELADVGRQVTVLVRRGSLTPRQQAWVAAVKAEIKRRIMQVTS